MSLGFLASWKSSRRRSSWNDVEFSIEMVRVKRNPDTLWNGIEAIAFVEIGGDDKKRVNEG